MGDARDDVPAATSDPRTIDTELGWFVAREAWETFKPIWAQIVKVTDQRVYYGPERKSWNGRASRKFVEKRWLLAINVSQAIAMEIAATYVRAQQEKERAKNHYHVTCDKIDAECKRAIAALLPSPQTASEMAPNAPPSSASPKDNPDV